MKGMEKLIKLIQKGKTHMSTIVIDLSSEAYHQLKEQADRAGQAPETYTRQLVEATLQTRTASQWRTTRQVLEAAGRVRPLSEPLRRKIIPGVTLDEVRAVLNRAKGPSLSQIIAEQRGPKA